MTDEYGSDPANGHTRRGRHRRVRGLPFIGPLSRRKGLLLALPVLASLGFVLVLNTVMGAPPANDTTSPTPNSSDEALQPDSGHVDSRFASSTDPVNTVSPTPSPAPSAQSTNADRPRSTPLPQPPVSTPTSSGGNGGIAQSLRPEVRTREEAGYASREEPHSDPCSLCRLTAPSPPARPGHA